jgi:hypothetical protein
MNLLFIMNYFGLHGSSMSILALARKLNEKGFNIFFIGCDGYLKDRFSEIAEDIFLEEKYYHLPDITRVILLSKLIIRWNIDFVIGVGRFEALEAQVSSHLILKKPALSYLNFSRPLHWPIHPQWHLPKVGYITVNAPYYKDQFVWNYQWPSDKIVVLEARYEMPESMMFRSIGLRERVEVLIVRRLDFPKYKSVLKSIDELDAWNMWNQWSLKIIGGGTHEHAVKKEVDKICSAYPEADISMLGQIKDVRILMTEAMVVIGSERVVVEGIAQGCLVILASDDGIIDLITPENIEQYSYDNFCGYNYQRKDHLKIKEEFIQIFTKKDKVKQIITGNFEYAKKHFDVDHGSEVLHNLIKLSSQDKVNMWDLIISFYRVLKSWISVYVFLCKDKIFSLF